MAEQEREIREERGSAEEVLSAWDVAVAAWMFAHPHAWRLRASMACSVPFGAAAAAEPLMLAGLVGEMSGSARAGTSMGWVAAWAAMGATCAVSSKLRDKLAALVAAEVGEDLRRQLADRQMRAVSRDVDLKSTAVTSVEGVVRVLFPVLPSTACELAALAASGVTACVLDWRVGLFVVLAAGPIAWVLTRLSRRLRAASCRYGEALEHFGAETDRFFPAPAREVVTAMRARRYVLSRVASSVDRLRIAEQERLVTSNIWPTTKLVGVGLGFATVAIAQVLGDLTLGTQVGFITLSLKQVEQGIGLVIMVGALAGSVHSVRSVRAGLVLPIEPAGGLRPSTSAGRLDVDGATASYPGGGGGVQGITLRVRPGERVAIVGVSAAGKSTLIRLLTGHPSLELLAGRVTLDGTSVAAIDPDLLNETVVLVPQGTWIFEGTVWENLLPDEHTTRADAAWACRLAGVYDEIAARPGGFQARIEPASVSGGQAQRLGMARGFLRLRSGRARVLILDEATTGLGRKAITNLLDRVIACCAQAGISVLLITHALPVHPDVRRVVVIDGGRVVEDGDPEMLAATPGSTYARLIAGA